MARNSKPIRTHLLTLAAALAGSLLLLLAALLAQGSAHTVSGGTTYLLGAALLFTVLGMMALVGLQRQLDPTASSLNSRQRKTDRPRSAANPELIGPLPEPQLGVEAAAANTRAGKRFPADTQAHLLHDIINQLPYPIFALDDQGQVLFVNAALADLYHTTPAKLVQSNLDGHLRRLNSEDLLTRPSGNAEGEEWLTTLDGEERRYLVQRLPFQSQIEGELVVAVDVTELHKLQLQLQFSQRLEVLGTLAGGIAHDFNNLLTPILGYSSILLESDLEPRHRDKIQAIATAANRARKVARQMLSFSRQHDDFDAKERIDLSAVVQEAATFMRASVPPNIDIQTEILDSPWINADSGQIHQVLVNLCTNATQAIEAPSGSVILRCREVLAGDPALPTLLRHSDCALVEVI